MATINKQSLRDEIDSLQKEFSRLSEEETLSPATKSLFVGLMTIVKIMLAIFLEKTTKKTSKNSNIPPSQTEKDETSKSITNSRGKTEKTMAAANTRTVESVEIAPVNECDNCGEDLSGIKSKARERRTRIDIVFEKREEHIEAEIKKCPSCHETVKGKFPNDLKGPLQYGNGIKAYAIQLLVMQMLSLSRAQKLIATMIGRVISEATLLSYILKLFFALEIWEQSAKASLLQLPCINGDETSMRVDKKNYWVHSYSGEDTTLKLLHRKRGKEAMNEFKIIPKYGGVVVHDCWSAYLSYGNCGHGLCGSHILRELTHIVDSNNYSWAKNMKKLLQETCRKVSKLKNKHLSTKQYIPIANDFSL